MGCQGFMTHGRSHAINVMIIECHKAHTIHVYLKLTRAANWKEHANTANIFFHIRDNMYQFHYTRVTHFNTEIYY